MFPGGIEMQHWTKMGQGAQVLKKSLFERKIQV